MKTQKMLLVIDPATGRVVGAAHTQNKNAAKINTGLVPLPGQEIHEIEVPQEITRLKSGHSFHMAISHAKFNLATRKLEFPEVSFKKLKH